MSRKIVERSIWSNELRRRSPRISALDQQHDKNTPKKKDMGKERFEGSSGVKRRRQEEDIESQNQKEDSSTSDQEVVTEAKEKESLDNGLPDKHLLELVLDVLQRRDTHEIFAEPVDPQEVEDYYEIVKEPMDFGTMRAKLHEGMYKTLEEFEHDVFLIPRNALHFNSTGSVYFRQARAIDDLAKKVFHVLKTNPKKLESEFSGTRRRESRRLQEGKGLKICPRSTVATNVSESNIANNCSSSVAEKSDYGLLDLKKSSKGNPHLSYKASCISIQGSEFSTVTLQDGRRYNANEMDRRSTYIPSGSVDWVDGTVVSTMAGGEKLLTHVNQGDLSYSESLLKFAQGLGPVAQMVAKRKLQQCTYLQQTAGTPRVLINLNATSYENDTENISSVIQGADPVFNRHISKPYGNLYSHANGVESLNLSGLRHEKLENPGFGNAFGNDFKRGFSNLRPNDSSVHGMGVEPSQVTPPVSPFAFNLSFLKSKLNQMENPTENQDGSSTGKVKRTSFGYTQLADLGSILACDNGRHLLTKDLGGNLALKL